MINIGYFFPENGPKLIPNNLISSTCQKLSNSAPFFRYYIVFGINFGLLESRPYDRYFAKPIFTFLAESLK